MVAAALTQNCTFMDQVGAIDDAQCLSDIVICYEHTDALILQAEDDFLNFCNANWVNPAERLVEQDELWFCDQGASDFQSPPFTAAQGIGFLLGKMF